MTIAKAVTTRRWAMGLLASLGLAACATVLGTSRPKGPGEEIRMSHNIHKDVACEMCHETAATATKATDDLRPKEAKCLDCHGDKKDGGECSFCHTDAKKPGTYAKHEPAIIISHANHMKRVKDDCGVCHKQLSEFSQPGFHPPTMETCNGCHNHQADTEEGRCQKCHLDLKRYQLKPVAAFAHRGDYLHEHGRIARSNADACSSCHDQTFCADCHAKTAATRVEVKISEDVERDFIHRGDYLSRHAIEAKENPTLCQRCHGQSFCTACHNATNAGPGGANPRSPHPAGWAYPGPESHGNSARREVVSCAGCHDQGPRSNCINCHKKGGVGGEPHPRGWGEKHTLTEATSKVMCGYCHNS